MIVTIKDTTFSGTVNNKIELDFQDEIVTIKKLIEKRVAIEVLAYNKKELDYFNGLVQPAEAEITLNGYKLNKNKEIDVEKQVYTALDAFTKNGYFVLIDNTQAEKLDQKVQLRLNSDIRFIKLTPLVGG